MYLHTSVSKLMGFLTSEMQKKCQFPGTKAWSCFLWAPNACRAAQRLLAASSEAPPGLDSQDRKRRKGKRETKSEAERHN